MPTFLQSALGAIIRWLLTLALGGLLTHNILTQGEFNQLVLGLVGVLLTLVWSLWRKYVMHWWITVALNQPAGTTQEDIAAKVETGIITPPSLTQTIGQAILPNAGAPK